jgi:hypothetical protein
VEIGGAGQEVLLREVELILTLAVDDHYAPGLVLEQTLRSIEDPPCAESARSLRVQLDGSSNPRFVNGIDEDASSAELAVRWSTEFLIERVAVLGAIGDAQLDPVLVYPRRK